MLITHADILDLLQDEGKVFLLFGPAAIAVPDWDYGVPAEAIAPTPKTLYGSYRLPRMGELPVAGGNTQTGTITVFFAADQVERSEFAPGCRVEHEGRSFSTKYVSEITVEGMVLMHQVDLSPVDRHVA